MSFRARRGELAHETERVMYILNLGYWSVMSVNLVLNLVSKVKVRLFHARCRCFEAAGILYGGHAGGCRAVGERHSPYDSTYRGGPLKGGN